MMTFLFILIFAIVAAALVVTAILLIRPQGAAGKWITATVTNLYNEAGHLLTIFKYQVTNPPGWKWSWKRLGASVLLIDFLFSGVPAKIGNDFPWIPVGFAAAKFVGALLLIYWGAKTKT